MSVAMSTETTLNDTSGRKIGVVKFVIEPASAGAPDGAVTGSMEILQYTTPGDTGSPRGEVRFSADGASYKCTGTGGQFVPLLADGKPFILKSKQLQSFEKQIKQGLNGDTQFSHVKMMLEQIAQITQQETDIPDYTTPAIPHGPMKFDPNLPAGTTQTGFNASGLKSKVAITDGDLLLGTVNVEQAAQERKSWAERRGEGASAFVGKIEVRDKPGHLVASVMVDSKQAVITDANGQSQTHIFGDNGPFLLDSHFDGLSQILANNVLDNRGETLATANDFFQSLPEYHANSVMLSNLPGKK